MPGLPTPNPTPQAGGGQRCGESLGLVLVREGYAERWKGYRGELVLGVRYGS